MIVSPGMSLGLQAAATALNPYDFARLSSEELGRTLTSATTTLGTEFDTAGVLNYAPNNLALYSDDLSNAAWTKSGTTIAVNQAVGRDGLSTLDRVKEAAGTGAHWVLHDTTVVNGSRIVMSGVVKGWNRDWAFLEIYSSGGTGQQYLSINLTDGSYSEIVASGGAFIESSVTDLGGGLYEWSATVTASSATMRLIASPAESDGTGRPTFAGDTGKGIYLGGLQIEQASLTQIAPTPYHTTTSAAYFGPRKQVVYDGAAWLDKGLLVEGAATNMLTYSEQLDNAAWTKTNATAGANAAVSPDGKTTMDSFTGDAGTAGKSLRTAVTMVNGTDYVYSFFVKKQASFIQVYSNSGWGGNSKANINLSTGAVSADFSFTASAEDFGTFWRVSVEGPATSTSSNIYISLITDITSARGSSTAVVGPIYLWGMQFELGTSPTSYVPTVASAVTRGGDDISILTADITGWDDEIGTFVVEHGQMSGSERLLSGESNAAVLYKSTNISTYNLSAALNSANGDVTTAGDHTSAVAGDASGRSITVDGAAVTSDSNTFIGTDITRLDIGKQDNNSNYLNGHIARITYYPTRLSDAAIQALTA